MDDIHTEEQSQDRQKRRLLVGCIAFRRCKSVFDICALQIGMAVGLLLLVGVAVVLTFTVVLSVQTADLSLVELTPFCLLHLSSINSPH